MSAELPHLLFLIFASLAIAFSVLVITMNNPVHSALSLVFVFIAASALWLLMQAEFLALILVLVYVGAVMTLFLFVVMMINVDIQSQAKRFMMYMPIGALIISIVVTTVMKVLPTQLLFAKEVSSSVMTNTESLGSVLYTDYVYAFEIAAVLLLVAIISAIALVHRQRNTGKRQDILKQLMTSKKDRLKIVKMAPVQNK